MVVHCSSALVAVLHQPSSVCILLLLFLATLVETSFPFVARRTQLVMGAVHFIIFQSMSTGRYGNLKSDLAHYQQIPLSIRNQLSKAN